MFVISVDAGNKQTKTEHVVFHSGFKESVQPQLYDTDKFYFNGRYYVPSGTRFKYQKDKTRDDRHFVLTLMGVARELDHLFQNTNEYSRFRVYEITLLVGLPPMHYMGLYEKLQDYMLERGQKIEYTYKDKEYKLRFQTVEAYPQGYSAALTVNMNLSDCLRVLVIDIGGITADYLLLRRGVADLDFCDSLERGVIFLYNNIIKSARQQFDLILEESDIDDIIAKRESHKHADVKNMVMNKSKEFVVEFLAMFREMGIDFNTTLTIFNGGGSLLLQKVIEDVWNHYGYRGSYHLIRDINANARGYRIQYEASR